jgi:hypothetical protein
MGNINYYQKGWEAFESGMVENDYDEILTKAQRREWRDGYNDAKREEQNQAEEDAWNEFAAKCPWYYKGLCRALTRDDEVCAKHNCAPLYFKEHNP